jgi:hypothetical protein
MAAGKGEVALLIRLYVVFTGTLIQAGKCPRS